MNSKSKKNNENLYLLTRKAMPEVLLDVLKVKELIENYNSSVTSATNKIGISRSTYYKYCDEVFKYDSIPNTKAITLEILTVDKIGTLSIITNTISKNNFNILTINQFPPVKNSSMINISIINTNEKCNLNNLIEEINKIENIKEVKIKSINECNK